jgi:hypothetical protein
LLDVNDVKTEARQPIRYVFCSGVSWPVAYHSLRRFYGFRIEPIIGSFDGLEIRHASRDDSGSVSSATELKVSFEHIL